MHYASDKFNINVGPDIVPLILSANVGPQKCGPQMLARKYWPANFGPQILTRKFWPANIDPQILARKNVARKNVARKCWPAKMWPANFGPQILTRKFWPAARILVTLCKIKAKLGSLMMLVFSHRFIGLLLC